MCGNGGRCAARFAFLKGIAGTKMSFQTVAGLIDAEVKGDLVKLRLTDPFDLRIGDRLSIDDRSYAVDSINTGVPHAVYFVDDAATCDVVALGRKTRYHDHYHPRGTNANFVEPVDRHTLVVRTYERGVEDETLACGTGCVASALIAAWKGLVEAPVDIRVRSGEMLRIYFEKKRLRALKRSTWKAGAKVVCDGALWEEAYR